MANIQDVVKTVFLKDIYDGSNINSLRANVANLLGLNFSSDTGYMTLDGIDNTALLIFASGTNISTVQIYNIATGVQLASINSPNNVAQISPQPDPYNDGVIRYWKDNNGENCIFQISSYSYGFSLYIGYITGTDYITGQKKKYFFNGNGNGMNMNETIWAYSDGIQYKFYMISSNTITSNASLLTLLIPVIHDTHNVVFDKLNVAIMINIGNRVRVSDIFNLDGHDYIILGRNNGTSAPLCMRIN